MNKIDKEFENELQSKIDSAASAMKNLRDFLNANAPSVYKYDPLINHQSFHHLKDLVVDLMDQTLHDDCNSGGWNSSNCW